jgi:hypothetical protein
MKFFGYLIIFLIIYLDYLTSLKIQHSIISDKSPFKIYFDKIVQISLKSKPKWNNNILIQNKENKENKIISLNKLSTSIF